jgi:ATPase subunit of ABC transporter with duplicated ATPase domains
MEEQKNPKKRVLDEVNINDRAQSWTSVPLKLKLEHSRAFLDNLRKIEDLELETEKLKRENQKFVERYPDLKAYEGLQDKWFRKEMFNILDDTKTIRVFGATREKAEKAWQERKELEKKNQEKNPKKQRPTKSSKE